jgi:RsiW-degrading membrane proteinase PrsW (M82 family)
MDLLLWITVGFIVIGFVVLVSMKKSMERKVALIKENEESMESKQISNKPVIWWIVGATVWGLVSMFLIVRSFSVFM